MNSDLSGKTALITGGSRGLGFACANALHEAGANVVLASSSAQRIEEATTQLRKQSAGGTVDGIVLDFKSNSLQEQLDALSQRQVDILLVSTAHPPTFPFSTATDEQWEDGHKLILAGPRLVCAATVPAMKQRRFGRIVFLGSIFGREPEVSSIIQSTYRTALNGFMKCLATECAPFGVTANVICPGYFETPLVQELAGKYARESKVPLEQILNDWKQASPMKRFGDPRDLGALVAFLSGPHGSFITGTCLTIDGGAVRTP